MAKLLPNELAAALTIAPADVLLVQVDGETEVKQITGANLFTDYYNITQTYTQTEVNDAISASASESVHGIKYSWADAIEKAAQTGMTRDEQGVQLDDRNVYQYDGAAWVLFYELDGADVISTSDIGVSVQGYSADTVIDATYVATANDYTTVDKTKVDFISVTGATNLDNLVFYADIGVVLQGYDIDTVIDATYVATANDYTTVDKTKVAKIESVSALTAGATVAVDMSANSQFSLLVTAGLAFTLSNPTGLTAGQSGFITITQDATTVGTLTLDTNYVTAGGAAIALTATLGAVDVLKYEVISATMVLVTLIADVK